MSISYETEVFSQSSIYNKDINTNSYNRKLKVYFSAPQSGVNEDTGLLLFIAGFSGQANSNVYKKMRDKFSDKYNLVTIQCDYFGYEFMQSAESISLVNINKENFDKIFTSGEIEESFKNGQLNFDAFLNVGSKYNINLDGKADLSKENRDNFNDMGMLQAIDNITAILNVMNILYDSSYNFNSKKIIIYGHSQGAYLSYLCNAFAPELFSLIIDNSAWLYPVYLSKDINRYLCHKIGNLTLNIKFDYLAKKIIDDTELLSLSYLYSRFNNNCKIISYHGTTDNLISHLDKSVFCSKIRNCVYNEISQDKVDNIVFKSTNHGLDSDFIELFDYTMSNFNINFEKDTRFDLQNEVVYETSKHKYIINYEDIIPKIKIL